MPIGKAQFFRAFEICSRSGSPSHLSGSSFSKTGAATEKVQTVAILAEVIEESANNA